MLDNGPIRRTVEEMYPLLWLGVTQEHTDLADDAYTYLQLPQRPYHGPRVSSSFPPVTPGML